MSEAQIIECLKNGLGSVFNYIAVPALYTKKGNGIVLKRPYKSMLITIPRTHTEHKVLV